MLLIRLPGKKILTYFSSHITTQKSFYIHSWNLKSSSSKYHKNVFLNISTRTTLTPLSGCANQLKVSIIQDIPEPNEYQ